MRRTSFRDTSGLARVNDSIKEYLAVAGNAKSKELQGEAAVLAASWRRVLSGASGARIVKTGKRPRAVGGRHSAPGSPPLRGTGILRASVTHGVVGAVRRVGPTLFTAPFLEEGVDTRKPRKSATKRRTKLRQEIIAPRPSAQRALDGAAAKLGDAFAARVQLSFSGA